MFNTVGRLNRADYFLANIYFVVAVIFFAIISVELGLYIEPLFLFILGGVLQSFLAAARFHDINVGGNWGLIMFLPLINAAVFIYLVSERGDLAENRWGKPMNHKGNPLLIVTKLFSQS